MLVGREAEPGMPPARAARTGMPEDHAKPPGFQVRSYLLRRHSVFLLRYASITKNDQRQMPLSTYLAFPAVSVCLCDGGQAVICIFVMG